MYFPGLKTAVGGLFKITVSLNVARIIYPHTLGKGVYKPEKFVKFFPKVYPDYPL